MEQKKVFEYSLCDAWHMPIRTIMISEGDKNTVLLTGSSTRFSPESMGELIEINDTIMSEIKRIIHDSGVMKFKKVEENMDVFVLDGYIHEFCFAQDESYHTIWVCNLDTYQRYKKKYPKAAALLTLLHKLKVLLVPEGVNGEFFRLTSG